jgi:excinuclease ABC subunit A
MKKIVIQGARENNLKNISLELPRGKFIAFTGVSGSGKSTLALDTIFAEGQRRYLESLSSYARQFLGQMDKPDVDLIDGLSPAISISQKTAGGNPRSTVGTVTEIYDYLRLLFAKAGTPHCLFCGKEIKKISSDEMLCEILDQFPEKETLEIYAPIVRGRKGEYQGLLENLYREGYEEALVNGRVFKLSAHRFANLDRHSRHRIEVLVDRLELEPGNLERLNENVEQALKLAGGTVTIKNKEKTATFNRNQICPDCNYSSPEIEPRSFSFNSPYGACPDCDGLGRKLELSEKLIIPDYTKTIGQGGLLPWSYRTGNWIASIINAVTQELKISTHDRLKDIPAHKMERLLKGDEEPILIKVRLHSHHQRIWRFRFSGLLNYLEKRHLETDSEKVRKEIEKYMIRRVCPACQGARLKKESLLVKIGGKNISQVTEFSIQEAVKFFSDLKLTKTQAAIAKSINKEIQNRLSFLENVGLSYLSLSRASNTLSGGESQRIRLASQIGAGLTGVLYILDEPSIGLHAKDNQKLLTTLHHLRDLENTVIVIEHDEETILSADWLTDIGPEAGKKGGNIVVNAPLKKALKNSDSLTVRYLTGEEKIAVPATRRRKGKNILKVVEAEEHNLRKISPEIPLGSFTVVTGVSGSGKSTLVNEIIYKTLARHFYRSLEQPGRCKEIKGLHHLKKVINVDQSPIGRTPRSNPATYTKVFTPIRELFAQTKDARQKGFGPGRFSFNVNGGRCENCKGEGFLKVSMQFLPDVYLPCDICQGQRFKKETLKIHYRGKNIAEVLGMTVTEAFEFFHDIPQIADILKVIDEVGLGYIQLGQAATTLSGGEAQRVKLASELAKRSVGQTLYILDEPTTGLHFEDIKKLLSVLQKLTDQNNTVLVIEHNLDVIKSADWIIDLGPEGGKQGGKIIAQGSPEEIIKYPESATGQFLKEKLV